jgi:hypothetical protein
MQVRIELFRQPGQKWVQIGVVCRSISDGGGASRDR